ncbi:unnamed protein product [Onchocerca flexuosa]|uniref:F-box domain-containing protein n=2 Tax=Onchocerca flexuosa TaxID=387005 RepID=A0A183I1D3_9BILA|nr:unnamed protein product [Onchocerca flexuosa]
MDKISSIRVKNYREFSKMIAHTWKLFVLLIISIFFNAINGAPIDTISTEQTVGFIETNEYLSVMMRSYPVLKRLMQYFATLNSSDLLSAHGTCKSFYGLASKELNRRIRPLIIRNGKVSGRVDQQIYSTYEQKLADTEDFLELRNWQPQIALLFDDCDNRFSKKYMPCACPCYRIIPHNDRFAISFSYPPLGMLGNNYPQSAVIIPEMYNASVDVIYHDIDGWHFPEDVKSYTEQFEIKLIIAFRESVVTPSDIETDIDFIIPPRMENISVPICYVLHIDEIQFPWSDRLFIMFSGNNIKASTFLIGTTDEEKLRKKFLKWKVRLIPYPY